MICCLDNNRLPAEDLLEGLDDGQEDFVYQYRAFQELRHGGDVSVLNSTRDDGRIPVQVWIDVQRETVGRDPTRRNPHTDGCDLPLGNPDPREALLPPGGDVEPPQGADHGLFQVSEILVQVFPVRAKIENRIPNELAGAVVRYVPSPPDVEHLDTFGFQLRWAAEEVLVLRRGTPSNHVGVFQEQKLIGDLTRPSPPHQRFLNRQPFPIRENP
jgi:hypothetical protein